jgi:acyl carrier protein
MFFRRKPRFRQRLLINPKTPSLHKPARCYTVQVEKIEMANKNAIEQKILKLVSEILGMPRPVLDTPILDADHYVVVDSLTIVRLINRVDAEFGVHLADDLDLEAIETPRKLVEYVYGAMSGE